MLLGALGNLLPLLEFVLSESTLKPSVGMSGCHKISEKQRMANFRTQDAGGFSLMFLEALHTGASNKGRQEKQKSC